MMFHVGQKVVCVDDRIDAFCSGARFCDDLGGLRKGQIYTIRGFYYGGDPDWTPGAVYLYEIFRPLLPLDTAEAPFHPDRFRPVVTTDIAIFTAMLAPAPKERADA